MMQTYLWMYIALLDVTKNVFFSHKKRLNEQASTKFLSWIEIFFRWGSQNCTISLFSFVSQGLFTSSFNTKNTYTVHSIANTGYNALDYDYRLFPFLPLLPCEIVQFFIYIHTLCCLSVFSRNWNRNDLKNGMERNTP